MKRNRLITVWTLSLLLLALLTACSGNSNSGSSADAGEPHTHTAGESWKLDLTDHWHVCECGEVLEKATHEPENEACGICGSEIWAYDDGSGDIYSYNEHGDMIAAHSFDSDGKLFSQQRIDYEYDENGHRIFEALYMDGVLSMETAYTVNAFGESLPCKETSYNSDGSSSVNEYDEEGNRLYYANCSADGSPLYEIFSEYAETADGNIYESKTTDIDYESGVKYESDNNEHGHQTTLREYDLDGNLISTARWEREYNDEGDRLWEKFYRDDRLVEELTDYAVYTDEYGWSRFPTKIIAYYEDGSRLITTNDSHGNTASETEYSADGSVIMERIHIYEYGENGSWITVSVHENGRLVTYQEYSDGSDGWTYLSRQTDYAEDDSCTVIEYDENGEITSETAYDAAGNAIG